MTGTCPICGSVVAVGPKCLRCAKFGALNPNYKGGVYTTARGYRKLMCSGHPRADHWGYVYEHILKMEDALGRRLAEGEEVHHRNRDRVDNRIENLQLFKSHREHLSIGHPERKTGNLVRCLTCNKLVYRKPSTLSNHTFCSQACKRPELWIRKGVEI